MPHACDAARSRQATAFFVGENVTACLFRKGKAGLYGEIIQSDNNVFPFADAFVYHNIILLTNFNSPVLATAQIYNSIWLRGWNFLGPLICR